jgi:hypothetical protein
VKNRTLIRNYGISLDEYHCLLLAQNSRCAICKTEMKDYSRRFSVDHCHITNKVRGLLCLQCNVGIGNLKESPTVIVSALDYLLSHGGETNEGN